MWRFLSWKKEKRTPVFYIRFHSGVLFLVWTWKQSWNPLLLPFLTAFLLVSAEVQKLILPRLQEHLLQPGHVVLQGRRLKVLHHPPHWRHHGIALVGERGEAHHHSQLFVRILAALQEVWHVHVHLWSQLEAVGFLRQKKKEKGRFVNNHQNNRNVQYATQQERRNE